LLTNNGLNHCETLTQRYHKYLPTNKNNCDIFYLSLLRYYYQFASATNHYIMGRLGVTEILIILAVVLLLFGGKKIPELMKGLGSGIKEFKNAAKDDQPADKKSEETK
jgi:sec-independent protein translocase protein TatA